MVRRTRAEAAATREAILDAAEQEFLARGVSRTSLQDIAQRVGVTRGAIYWHFKDKVALFTAMLDRVHLSFWDSAEALVESFPPDDPLGRIRAMCRFALEKIKNHPTYRNLCEILVNHCEHSGEMSPAFEYQLKRDGMHLAHLEVDLARARGLGQVAPGVDPRVATCALYALIRGIYTVWLRSPGSFDVYEDGNAMLDLFFAGLRAGPSTGPRQPCEGELDLV